MPKKPPIFMEEKNTVSRKFLKNTLGLRKKKIKAGVKEDYCKGFIDAHGQWNNGFYCPRWSADPNQVYCCGTKHDRYCCKPPGQESITGFSTDSFLRENGPSSIATPNKAATNSSSVAPQCYLDCNITTIAALTISISVLLTLVMLILCWVWPRYMMYRNRKRTVQKITDGLGVPRTLIANTNGMTLVYQLQPMTSSLVGPSEIHQPMLLDRSSRATETSLYAVSEPPPYQVEETVTYKDKKLKVGLKKKRLSSEVLTNFNIVPTFYGQDQNFQYARVSSLSQMPLMLPPQGDYHEYTEKYPDKVAI